MFKRPSLGMPHFTVGTFFGELAFIVIGVLLALSVDEWRQSRARFGKQIDSMSSLIYGTLYEGGMRGMVENPQGLMMLIGSFSYREREIIGVFDETLAAIDAQ